MSSPAAVARHIKRINKIAGGPGAIRLPSVEYLKMSLRQNTDAGAASFWRSTLPQIQFHNPQLPIAVNRIDAKDINTPSKLLLKLSGGQEKDIDLVKKSSSAILTELIEATNAEKVPESDIPVLKEPLAHEI